MTTTLPTPIELTDSELDHVAAGQAGIVQTGLINAGVIVQATDVLNNDFNNNTVLSNNNTEVAVSVLGVTLV